MQENEFCRGVKHRNLILMYISWLTLSLAPTIVAPPEREFVRGQPEMQQAMDNMVTYGSMIMKRMDASSSDNTDHHEMLTSKTTNLLEKTELMLSSLPESKERKWLENFVERMRAISVMLQKTADSKNQNVSSQNSANDAPIPEGLPITPTWPTMTAVPEAIPFQKTSKMMPKFPVTSPEVSQVLPDNEYSTERHPATKPAVVMEKDDDELVRELENLHQEFAMHVPEQKSKVKDQVPAVTTLSTPLFPEIRNKKLVNVEEEKEKLKEKLFQEIAELQRLGGTISRDIMDGLSKDNQKEAGLTTNQNTESEYNLKFTEAHMGDRPATEPLKEFKGENKEISNQNIQNQDLEKSTPYQKEKLLQQENLNHSVPNVNFNQQVLSKEINNFHHMPPQSKELSYLTGFQNVMHGFPKPNPYNSNEQYHAMLHSPNQQPGHIPDALKQMLSKPHNKIYNQNLVAARYNRFLMKNGYGPYPYMQNWNHKSSTNHPPLMMPTYQIKQPVNHQMDVQLSDEMKRQLRDGKIIVLSDSVVRSNFEPCKDAEKKENEPNKPSPTIEEKKNDTITSN